MAIKVEKIVLGALDTNTYIVENTETNEFLVIDPATEDDMLLNSVEGKNVKYILLTHCHFDHIGGAKKLYEKTGAPVMILKAEEPQIYHKTNLLMCRQVTNKEFEGFEIQRFLNEGDVLEFGDETIRILHTPGHTAGGACYMFENSRILFTGDTLFHLSAGRTDFPSGDPREELHSLARISKLEGDYKIYCGHNEDTTLQYERENNRYMIMSLKIK